MRPAECKALHRSSIIAVKGNKTRKSHRHTLKPTDDPRSRGRVVPCAHIMRFKSLSMSVRPFVCTYVRSFVRLYQPKNPNRRIMPLEAATRLISAGWTKRIAIRESNHSPHLYVACMRIWWCSIYNPLTRGRRRRCCAVLCLPDWLTGAFAKRQM